MREIVIPDRSHHGDDKTKNENEKMNTEKTNMKKNILISEGSDAYGICSDAQIEAVKTRMEIISREMGLSYRYDDGAQDFPQDMHEYTELVFELAMACRYKIPFDFVNACAVANTECPIPRND